MKVKRNDTVKVVSGKDRGRKGKVVQVFPKQGLIVVEGVNKMFKHLRPQKKGEKGQKIEYDGPIHASNVMVICPKCEKPARLGKKLDDKNKKKRYCKKCKEKLL